MDSEIKIDGIFEVEAVSCCKLLTDQVFFVVPNFQRRYSWGESSICRLFDDIYESMIALGDRPNNITFIGSTIFTDGKLPKISQRAYSVIDGQQRISTIVLTTSILYSEINSLLSDLESFLQDEKGKELSQFVENVIVGILVKLRRCFSDKFDPFGEDIANQYPKLTRQDVDSLSSVLGEQKYESPIAEYLYAHILHLSSGASSPFQFDFENDSSDYILFRTSWQIIRDHLRSQGRAHADFDSFPIKNSSEFLSNSTIRRSLFPNYAISKSSVNKLLKLGDQLRDKVLYLIYLSGFSSYLLDRVAFTKVVSTDENYAFDIFEALNSTGEPLTAFETLRPLVSSFEDEVNKSSGGYLTSQSYQVFKRLDDHVDALIDPEKKQRESGELVILLTLLVDGARQSAHLTTQRRYLRGLFETLSSRARKRAFIDELGLLVDFRRTFWSEEGIEGQLTGYSDREEVLMCIDFIRSMQTVMAIPLLTRYYYGFLSKKNYQEFAEAARATAAFLALWRSAFGSTSQIDDAFREIMSHGVKKQRGAKGICITREINREPLPATKLKKYYSALLKKKNVEKYASWEAKYIHQPLYSKSKPLARFLLFLSSHHTSVVVKTGLMKKTAQSYEKDYLQLSRWRSESLKTLEHVAPQKPKDGGWPDDIYSEDLVDTMGNLTLLPEKVNSSFGNQSWANKKMLFEAFSEETPEKRVAAIKNAADKGFAFSNKIKEAIKHGESLPVGKAIAVVDEWSSDLVRQRTRNIGKLSWQKLNSWLN